MDEPPAFIYKRGVYKERFGCCGRNVIGYARRRRLTIYDECYVIATGGDERVGIRRNVRVRLHRVVNCSEVPYYW